MAKSTHAWQLELWTNHVIAVDFGAFRLVDIFALNGHAARESLFMRLQQWLWQQHENFIARGFKLCTNSGSLQARRDKVGRPESATLQTLLHQLNMEDALTPRAIVEDDDGDLNPIFFTY